MLNTLYKTTRWWLALLLFCLPAANTSAQNIDIEALPQCPSYIWDYPSSNDTSSLICGDDNHRVILTQYHDPAMGINRHSFIIKDYFTNVESYFSTYFNSNGSNDYNVSINDMVMYNGECYFCGTMTYPYLELESNYLYISRGIIGHFSPQALQSLSGSIMFSTFEEARYFWHLTVTQYQDVSALVCAVGLDRNSGQGCLLEAYNDISTGWKYNYGTIPNVPGIIFSDILASCDSITLLAQLKCQNVHGPYDPNYDINHQVFLVDRSGRRGFYHDFNSAPLHYIAHYFLNDSYNFHESWAPMRLYNTNFFSNTFGVAFGVKDYDLNADAIRLFAFPHKMKYDKSIHYETGLYPRILDISTNAYGSYSPCILSNDNTFSKSVLSVPLWSNLNSTVPMRHLTDCTLQSLTQHRSQNAVDISSESVDQNLNLIYQNIDSIHISCLNKITKHYLAHPEKKGTMLVANWDFKIKEQYFTFNVAEIIEHKEINGNEICKTCNNN